MENLVNFALEKRYESIKRLGDRLDGFSTLINWERFRTVVGDLYRNQTGEGGRPNIDIVLMVKMLVLQSMYSLSDPELERQANDRISFMKFLGYPNKVPDQTTVWYFRERLAKTGKDKEIWDELQRQLDAQCLKIKKRHHPGCDIHHLRSRSCFNGHTPAGRCGKNSQKPGWNLGDEGQKILFRIQTPYQRGL